MKQTKKLFKKLTSYLAVLSLLAFTYCQNIDSDIVDMNEPKLTISDNVISLMKQVAESNVGTVSAKSTKSYNETPSCTGFAYPMKFFVTFSDIDVISEVIISNDQELIDFFNEMTTTTAFTVNFPVTLLDIDGNKTIVYNIVELEGILQFAVDACEDSFPTDDGSGGDDGDNDDGDGDDDGSNDDGDDDNDGDNDNDNDNDGDNDNDNDDDDNNDGDDDDNDDDDGYEYCSSNKKKVYICHNTADGGSHTICVSVNAIWAHVTHHGDKLGSCN